MLIFQSGRTSCPTARPVGEQEPQRGHREHWLPGPVGLQDVACLYHRAYLIPEEKPASSRCRVDKRVPVEGWMTWGAGRRGKERKDTTLVGCLWEWKEAREPWSQAAVGQDRKVLMGHEAHSSPHLPGGSAETSALIWGQEIPTGVQGGQWGTEGEVSQVSGQHGQP